MKWEPWTTYKGLKEVQLPIYEPPCKDCQFFRPTPNYTKVSGTFDGVTICHNDEMFHDFSCYRERDADS